MLWFQVNKFNLTKKKLNSLCVFLPALRLRTSATLFVCWALLSIGSWVQATTAGTLGIDKLPIKSVFLVDWVETVHRPYHALIHCQVSYSLVLWKHLTGASMRYSISSAEEISRPKHSQTAVLGPTIDHSFFKNLDVLPAFQSSEGCRLKNLQVKNWARF